MEESSQLRGLISREENFSVVKNRKPYGGFFNEEGFNPLDLFLSPMDRVHAQQIKFAFVFRVQFAISSYTGGYFKGLNFHGFES